MEQARNVKADILFCQQSGEFDGAGQTAPLLRTCAAYTWETATTKEEFVAAAVACGYNASTAGTCWHVGRKTMKELG